MNKSKLKFSLKKRLKSFKYAFNGFWFLIRDEHNARIHFFISILAIAGGFWLEISTVEWLFLLLTIGLVIIAEFINAAIEAMADKVTKKEHPYIRKAKDTAAGGVLFAAILSIIIGLIIFGPKLVAVLF